MEGHDVDQAAAQEAPTPLVLDRARRMAEIGRMTAETIRARSYRCNSKNTAAAAETAARKTKKLVEEEEEDLILQLMWEKACAPRHHYSSATWKPNPNDPGDEQLAGVYQKARAIIKECDRHVDDLILQYVNDNGGGETAIDDVPTTTRKKKKTKLAPPPVPDEEEASILNLMWHKACVPRRDFPAWRPRPNDTRVELIQAYEKGTAVIVKLHQHEDDLISQYINNGCA